MWQSPWDNAVRGGDQIAQALWGLAAGASAGPALGLGHTRFVPEGHTDLVLAAIGEELGLVGLLVVAATFFLIAWRGLAIARRASSDYGFFLALALTLSLAIPVLVMAAGILGLLPLTGVVTPFLSYGGSAMVANFCDARPARRHRPGQAVRPPTWRRFRSRSGGSAASQPPAAVIAVVDGRDGADAARRRLPGPAAARPAGRWRPRFQYNPRVLDVLRSIPRGTIYDRRGLPLASGDLAALAKAAPEFEQLGREMADASRIHRSAATRQGPRCFTCWAMRTRDANWSASNTSYVERDAEDLLRGFDDHAKTVATTDREGRPTLAVRRDYTAIVPLVRHRYEPDHPDVKAVLDAQARRARHDRRAPAAAPSRRSSRRRRPRDRQRQGRGRRPRRRHGRDPGERQLSAGVRPEPGRRSTPISIARGTASTAGLDVQDDHRGGSAARGCRMPGSRLRLLAAAQRPHRRSHSRLRPADSRRLARHGAARRASPCTMRPCGRATPTSPSWRWPSAPTPSTHTAATAGISLNTSRARIACARICRTRATARAKWSPRRCGSRAWRRRSAPTAPFASAHRRTARIRS